MSQGLKAIAGVIDAEVFFDAQRAEVRYLPDLVAPPALVKAVEETGFGARVLDPSATEGDGR